MNDELRKQRESTYPWFSNAGCWPEDAGLENGNYQNRCMECGEPFYGHKRRVVCKTCAYKALVTRCDNLENDCDGCEMLRVELERARKERDSFAAARRLLASERLSEEECWKALGDTYSCHGEDCPREPYGCDEAEHCVTEVAGMLSMQDRLLAPATDRTEKKKCTHCGGSGEMFSHYSDAGCPETRDCHKCNGTGKADCTDSGEPDQTGEGEA